ncbi:predicted protein [Scheffersomyces stipitis CBS 6054]|uniref:ERF1 methyltransferase catalytic subunit MTQ2 n=1 Tax=Scheffersomyces stipitis (strain ATCC 58785 / CBS 6054 / NBRC 10063 / NRRL Y-11545) TaxID=322104 RepID=A3GHC5_PICST|nr:predicted protein [Scheffersomyces stipitis CBS 6054]EAZ63030.2 predicted protein [Scheffersomyces stipitis CBS 6054]
MLPTPEVKHIDYDTVYEPSEDSFLLLDCFEQELSFLTTKFSTTIPIVTEIGTGSGIVTTFLQKNILQKAIYISTDVNPHACKTALHTVKVNNADSESEKSEKSKNEKSTPELVDICQMDLVSAIRPKIDVLLFNPPYVPAGEVPTIPNKEDDSTWLDLALLGGEDGMVITWKVLDSLDSILAENGVAYILFCARNKPDFVANEMTKRGWKVKEIIQRKAGWEVLCVLRFQRL